ncbi:hypothetical protein [Bacillus bombysepticus]|uniref:hypothetical protein n=1 Tax=Bacillus bombysepticus TaxID=658666 RepID=UPI003015BBE1
MKILNLLNYFKPLSKKQKALELFDNGWEHAYQNTRHLDSYREQILQFSQNPQDLEKSLKKSLKQ